MNKLLLSASIMAMGSMANAATTLGLDEACNFNGTLVDDAYEWNDQEHFYCELPAEIAVNDSIELAAKNNTNPILWVLPQIVTVGNGHLQNANPATVDRTNIIIQAGVNLVGAQGNSGLVFTRGTTIEVKGKEAAPVVFSSLDDGFSGEGEWGGLILSGFGDTNECPSEDSCTMEGISEGTYFFGGGANTAMSSGSINYLVITEGGHLINVDDPDQGGGDEINGLTLYAVNSSTFIENVHVHQNLDDGIEFFGGTVRVSNLWLTCNRDDSVDWDYGYQGGLTNVQIIQGENTDHAFELAGNPDEAKYSAIPLSQAPVNNVSVIFSGTDKVDVPFKLKEGTGGSFSNVALSGYAGRNCVAPGQIHIVETGDINQIQYDCENATGLLPASDTSATGFSAVTFWEDYPGCN